MKNVKLLAFAAAVAFATVGAEAAAISGSIAFDGDTFDTDTGNLATADAFTSFGNTEVSNGAGSYAGVAGESVAFNPFSFDPFVANNPLWTFTTGGGGGTTYSFEASSASVSFQQSFAIVVEGTGTASITGMDDTEGTFVITGNRQGQSFSFSAGSTVNVPTVPENGATLAFLALGLVALTGVSARRKVA